MTYELDIFDSMICVEGSVNDTRPLMRISGAIGSHLPDPGTYRVLLPEARFNFMAAEAVQIPTRTSEIYKVRRNSCLSARPEEVAEAIAAIQHHPSLRVEDFLYHQVQFLAFARNLDTIFNASEQGTGKTRMTLGLLETAPRLPLRVLVVTPKSVMREWKREWEQLELDRTHTRTYRTGATYTQHAEMHVLDSGSTSEKAGKIHSINLSANRTYVVVNYEALRGLDAAILSWNWDVVIFDESWKIKAPTSRMTQVALELSQVARRIILLSGTPVGNTAADLFTQCVALGIEDTPETYKQFAQRFCDLEEIMINDHPVTVRTGVQDPATLVAFMDPVWYRATKESTLNLPPKVNTVVELDLPEGVREIYDRGILADREVVQETFNITSLTGMVIRLQRMTGGFLRINGESREIACPKLEYIKEYLPTIPEESRVIIWCKYTDEIDRIARELNESFPDRIIRKVYKNVDGEELESIKHDFNSKIPGRCSIIVAQIKKLCAGHNLQGCDYNIYFSNSWSFIERAQSEDRSHRYGRQGTVTNIDLICRHTVDEEIIAALRAKQNLLQRIALTTAYTGGEMYTPQPTPDVYEPFYNALDRAMRPSNRLGARYMSQPGAGHMITESDYLFLHQRMAYEQRQQRERMIQERERMIQIALRGESMPDAMRNVDFDELMNFADEEFE